jgi:hypothetical protein
MAGSASLYSLRNVCLFAALIAATGAAICLGVAPTLRGDTAQAQQLKAHGVQVPLASADFTSHVIPATRASGSDSCTLDSVVVHFTFQGTPHSATLREVRGVDDLPTCAELRAEAAHVYRPGTTLLVDPGDPSSADVASYAAATAARTGYAGDTARIGAVLLALAVLLAVPFALHQLRRRPS